MLLWHLKVGISMYQNQEIMREKTLTENHVVCMVIPTFVLPRLRLTANCPVIKCVVYQLAFANEINPGLI